MLVRQKFCSQLFHLPSSGTAVSSTTSQTAVPKGIPAPIVTLGATSAAAP